MGRQRKSITGFGGISMTLDLMPERRGQVKSRKRQGKPDMTRSEYAGRYW